MATKKKTAKKPAKIQTPPDWTEAASKTDVPPVMISNEFHAPIAEVKPLKGERGGGRFWWLLLLSIVLIVLAMLFLWLTHEQPV